jgi:hypothetical protein
VSKRVVESGILSTLTGAASLLEIEFDGNRRKRACGFQAAFAVRLSTVIKRKKLDGRGRLAVECGRMTYSEDDRKGDARFPPDDYYRK